MPGKKKYDREAIVTAICERLATGEPLTQVLRTPGMPDVNTITLWREQDKDIDGRVGRARDQGHEALAVQCLAIIDQEPERVPGSGAKDAAHVAWQKARVETRLRLLACWDPRRYGNKVDLTSDGKTMPAPTIVLNAPGAKPETD